MKHRILTFAFLALLCTGCFPTRIVTYSPAPTASYYSTVVTPPRAQVATTVTQVYSASEDISLYLDLQAVAALFAQSSTLQEFEQMLNSSTYPVCNLDLNRDGYVDYLRVLETVQGYNHVFLIQAVLSANIYQDVATIVAEVPGYTNCHLEIIGAPYIYGPNYIVRPTFIVRPIIYDHLMRSRYTPWHSPWYWDHFPSHYRHPKPVYLNHYQAYVKTFMSGHRFCHEVVYPAHPHFNDYDRMTREFQRNDYGRQHPETTFTVRNANTPANGGQGGTVKNAYDIRMNSEASKITTTAPTRSAETTGRGTGATSTSSTSRGTASTSTSSTASSTSSRSTASSSSTPARSSSSTTTAPSATSRGTASTSTSSSSTSASRSTSSSTSSASRTSSQTSASRSGSSSTGSNSSSSTVVRSRVNSSGSSTTSVRSSSSSTSAARSSSSSSSSSSSNTTATRGTRRQ